MPLRALAIEGLSEGEGIVWGDWGSSSEAAGGEGAANESYSLACLVSAISVVGALWWALAKILALLVHCCGPIHLLLSQLSCLQPF